MKGTCKEVELKSGRQLHFAPQVRQEKRGRRHMNIRKATKNALEIRPGKTRIYKYVHLKRRRVECCRKNAQGNYEPSKYGHNASRRQLSCWLQIRGRYLQRCSTKDLVYIASRKNEREKRSRDLEIAKKQLWSHEIVRI